MANSVSDATFEAEVLKSPVPVVVDFFAEWCGPCKAMAPALDQVATERKDIKVVKLDVEANPHTAERYGVKGIPTLILFEAGEERDRMVNVIRRQAIEDRLGTLVP